MATIVGVLVVPALFVFVERYIAKSEAHPATECDTHRGNFVMKKGCAITLGLVALLVSGCALTPDYERPELSLPAGWERTTAEQEAIANRPWWDIYDDEVLRALIDRALEQNRDLALALARLQESRYLLSFTRADQFPFLDVFGSAGRGRESKRHQSALAGTGSNFGIGADLSFEIDLWRRYARATEAARAELLASEFGVRNVTISLIAEVADLYFRLQDVSARLEISRRTVEGRASNASESSRRDSIAGSSRKSTSIRRRCSWLWRRLR